MPDLKFCNLGFNDLSEANVVTPGSSVSLKKLTTLILVGTKVHFKMLSYILNHMAPCVEELHLSLNEYSRVEHEHLNETDKGFPTVTKLMFNGNCVRDWCELGKLGQLVSF